MFLHLKGVFLLPRVQKLGDVGTVRTGRAEEVLIRSDDWKWASRRGGGVSGKKKKQSSIKELKKIIDEQYDEEIP